MDRQIAVRGLQPGLQLVEVGSPDARQIGHDPQAHPAMDDLVDAANVKSVSRIRSHQTTSDGSWRTIRTPGSRANRKSPAA
ncbi:hypothetical protein D3C72_2222930 [compost metagenome]